MKIHFDLPPGSAQESNGVAVRYAAAKRDVPRWRWYILLVLLASLPLYFVVRFILDSWWETAPAVVSLQDAVVRAGTTGRIVTLVKPGTDVAAGQPLGRLAPTGAGDVASVPVVREPVGLRVDPSLPARRSGAQESLQLALKQLAMRRAHEAAVQRLVDQGAATAAELAAAQAQAFAVEAEVVRARADLTALQAIAAASTAATSAPTPESGAGRPPARDEPALALAPQAGRVLRLLVQNGDWVGPDTEVALLRGPAPARILAYVDPAAARYAQTGRRATLKFADGPTLQATVKAVGPEAQRLQAERIVPLTPRGQSIVVELVPDQPLPDRYHIHQLPLEVQFEHVWSWSTP